MKDEQGARTTPAQRRPPPWPDAQKVTGGGNGPALALAQAPTVLTPLLCAGEPGGAISRPPTLDNGWFKSHLSEADAGVMEHSGKMVLLFQILEMAQELGDKV